MSISTKMLRFQFYKNVNRHINKMAMLIEIFFKKIIKIKNLNKLFKLINKNFISQLF